MTEPLNNIVFGFGVKSHTPKAVSLAKSMPKLIYFISWLLNLFSEYRNRSPKKPHNEYDENSEALIDRSSICEQNQIALSKASVFAGPGKTNGRSWPWPEAGDV